MLGVRNDQCHPKGTQKSLPLHSRTQPVTQVRAALRCRGGVCWNDHVLVALSGGPSSWLALHTLLSMHAPGNQHPGKDKVRYTSSAHTYASSSS